MRRITGFGFAIVAMLGMGLAVLAGGSARPVAAQSAPTLQISGPSEGATVSNPVQMHVTSSGATIKAATDADASAAHYHYFIDRDPATVVQQGQPIPAGQPDIIHTNDANLPLPSLAPGQHTIWVVLAHTDHTPYNPSVQARVAFTVGAAAAAPAGGQAPAAGAAGTLPGTGSAGALNARRSQPTPATLVVLAALLLTLGGTGLYRAWRGTGLER